MHRFSYKPEPSWRKKQSLRVHKKSQRQKTSSAAPKICFLLLLLLLLFWGIWYKTSRPPEKEKEQQADIPHEPAEAPEAVFTDALLQRVLQKMPPHSLGKPGMDILVQGLSFKALTTVNPQLQEHLQAAIRQAETAGRGRPELLSLVVMQPENGKILGLAGSRSDQNGGDPSVALTLHPAASLFKIIAASAAMELHGLTPESPLFFNGDMYTLYKRQLSQQIHRSTNRTTLKDAFAKSVNPVFGKLGYHDLQESGLRQYALLFGFETPSPGNLPTPASRIEISEKPYAWAEIASGFNRKTLISPIHGARIAAAIVSDGILPPVRIIEKVMDAEGGIRYQGSEESGRRAIRKETADAMRDMMERTIRSGTVSRIFRGYTRDAVLSSLQMGGKTGSISNQNRDIRYDWFVGYALHPDGRKIVVSIMVGHGAYIGKRAGEYAKGIFSFWFDPARIPASAETSLSDAKKQL